MSLSNEVWFPHENIVVEGFHKLTHGDKVIPSTYRAEQEDHSKN